MRLALRTILLLWTADEGKAPVSATCHHIRYCMRDKEDRKDLRVFHSVIDYYIPHFVYLI